MLLFHSAINLVISHGCRDFQHAMQFLVEFEFLIFKIFGGGYHTGTYMAFGLFSFEVCNVLFCLQSLPLLYPVSFFVSLLVYTNSAVMFKHIGSNVPANEVNKKFIIWLLVHFLLKFTTLFLTSEFAVTLSCQLYCVASCLHQFGFHVSCF